MEELEDLAKKWRKWRSSLLKYLLLPVNIDNEHWCLLVVEVKNSFVHCWDSKTSYDGGEFVKGKKANLFRFLETFQGDLEAKWDLGVDFDSIPQQTGTNCGVFCIEFMRAFVRGCNDGGYNSLSDLVGSVKEDTMKDARAHILVEIKEKIFKEKKENENGNRRARKRTKKALEADQIAEELSLSSD